MKKKIVVMTGAGVSAESGLKTFRDADGLWEGHDVYEVASPEGWAANPALVLDFYNQRRRQLLNVLPNDAHTALARLESKFDVTIITQNVDDLHERGGSTKIIHLHGELLKSRGCEDDSTFYDCKEDIVLGMECPKGQQLRPHIVWFGEEVPELENAIRKTLEADIAIIVGTSLQVYPAASLISYTQPHCKVVYIDPNPHMSYELSRKVNISVIKQNASTAVPELVNRLLSDDESFL